MTELWTIENEIYDSGLSPLCGVDEAGRGPLAGPVCAAAVILPRGIVIEGLNDSKKLSEKKREALYAEITDKALAYGVAFASVEEIEEYNILEATFLAMNRAIGKLSIRPALALIDGNRNRGIETASRCVIGGDGKCADIAAASILAKVTRDRLMLALASQYPQYGFEKHKGYGTAAHYEAIRAYIEDAAVPQPAPAAHSATVSAPMPAPVQMPAEKPAAPAAPAAAPTTAAPVEQMTLPIPPAGQPLPQAFLPDQRIPKALRDLMISYQVSEWEMETAVESRGFVPHGTKIWDYDKVNPGIVNGLLVPSFDQVLKIITEMREKQEIPFN